MNNVNLCAVCACIRENGDYSALDHDYAPDDARLAAERIDEALAALGPIGLIGHDADESTWCTTCGAPAVHVYERV